MNHDESGHLCDWCSAGRPRHKHVFERSLLRHTFDCLTCDLEITDRDLFYAEGDEQAPSYVKALLTGFAQ